MHPHSLSSHPCRLQQHPCSLYNCNNIRAVLNNIRTVYNNICAAFRNIRAAFRNIRAVVNDIRAPFRDNPEWAAYLDDKGRDEAPLAYLKAVEEGLRSFGKDPAAMGKFAMSSQVNWSQVALWRKRECYIVMCRKFLELGNYRKYVSFLWIDYLTRQAMSKTFVNRHLQYTDGSKQLRGLAPDSNWSETFQRRKSGSRTVNAVSPGLQTKTSTPAACEDSSLMWDSEEDDWVKRPLS